MRDPIILAGDTALRAGFAIGSQSAGVIASTVIDVHKMRKRSLARATKTMQRRIVQFVVESGRQIDLVAYEEPTMHAKSANRLPQYAMATALILAADTCGVPGDALREWPSTVKKEFAGSGRASKSKMIEAASTYAGRRVKDDNEADAIALLAVVLQELSNPKEK
ncbi:MAG: hypothetical protein AAGF31_00845 [Planctomycetota bacterium]